MIYFFGVTVLKGEGGFGFGFILGAFVVFGAVVAGVAAAGAVARVAVFFWKLATSLTFALSL
jgi:hypothetical protein